MYSPVLILVAVATGATAMSGQHIAHMAIPDLFGRQTQCQPVTPPITCERSCGPGFVQCISFPTCYNPGAGESCCANGEYCPKGTYCTDKGCCDDSLTLEECGATITLSVVPPPLETTSSTTAPTSEPETTTTTATPTTSTTTSVASTTTTSPSPTTSTTSTTTTTQISTTSTTTSGAETSPSTSTPANSTPGSSLPSQSVPTLSVPSSNSSVTTSVPPLQTGNSGSRLNVNIGGFILGGMGFMFMWL